MMDWSKLRLWHDSKDKAFEGLCCQLAFAEEVPDGSQFFRKGTPDSGIECYWTLPDGSEWAWQAKYVFHLEASQLKNLRESFANALNGHPRLTKYFVCLPFNLSGGREARKESAEEKWKNWVRQQQAVAEKLGREIEFVLWDEARLEYLISDERHRGRHWFWFNEECFSDRWFRQKADLSTVIAGERFDAGFTVPVTTQHVLDALARNEKFETRWRDALAQFLRELRSFRDRRGHPSAIVEFNNVIESGEQVAGILQPFVKPTTANEQWRIGDGFDLKAAVELARKHETAQKRYLGKLYEVGRTADRRDIDKVSSDCRWSLHRLLDAAEPLLTLIQSDEARIAVHPVMVLRGEWGQGKTHLLCEFTKQQVANGKPCVLFFGEQFKHSDPWQQMVELLHLDCSIDEFLGALEAAAHARNTRAVIVIDALNEGPGNQLWKTFLAPVLKRVAASRWLGICVSVRSDYEESVIPSSIDSQVELTRVTHPGFEFNGWRAAEAFFKHYGVEPSTPMLDPEFERPLLLKMFCKALSVSKVRRVPEGMRGATAVFELWLEALNKKLSEPGFLDVDQRERVVQRAVQQLAAAMVDAQNEYVELEAAKRLVGSVHQSSSYSRSLFRHLESEGVIWVIPPSPSLSADQVRFTYQRFCDHQIVSWLLDEVGDNASDVAQICQKIGEKFGAAVRFWRRQGILNALAIQLPERLNIELPDILASLPKPDFAIGRYGIPNFDVHAAFVSSLVWRRVDSFSDSTFAYIDKELRRSEHYWLTVIGLATVPNHPLNADYLTECLRLKTMAERDAGWSIPLHRQWGEEGPIARLVDWAWSEDDKSMFSDEVIRLAGTTLAWFFTSSHRFLRDRATKGLVRICENRLSVLRQIIRSLHDVNDLYVAERLYAAAYGCAMRTQDVDGLRELAREVFEHVFASGSPPVHSLLRDYARGVIDCATHRCGDLGIEIERTYPPYGTQWPGSTAIPTLDDIKLYRDWSFYGSVTTDFEDFRKYVMDSFDAWTLIPRSSDPPVTAEVKYATFLASLTERQRERWGRYQELSSEYERHLRRGQRLLAAERGEQSIDDEDEIEAAETAAATRAERAFLRSLGLESQKARTYASFVRPYLENPYLAERGERIDPDDVGRWMVQRIVEMGWSPERFERFDEGIPELDRTAHKAERIGKKYQWLAFREAQARLGDSYLLDVSGEGLQAYEGMWQVAEDRDIDPSCLLPDSKFEVWESVGPTWWFTPTGPNWDLPEDELEWLKNERDMPAAKALISVLKPDDQSEWLTMAGFYQWKEPLPLGESRYTNPRGDLTYFLRGYLVRGSDSDRLMKWAAKQDFYGKWMPEAQPSSTLALGEFSWSREFKGQSNYYHGREGWTLGERLPVEVLVATDQYLREYSGYDCSMDGTVRIDLPCSFLIEEMELTQRAEGEWFLKDQLVAFDPSIRTPGPQVLLVNQAAIDDFLEQQNLALFWTVSAERSITGGDLSHKNYKGHLLGSGAFLRRNRKLHGELRCQFYAKGEHPKGGRV